MEHPDNCLQCGNCVAVCPVEMVGGHAIVTWLADPASSDYSVWLCTSCWRCQESCPGGVSIYELMMEQRRREPAPPGYQTAYESLMARGLTLKISQQELDQVRAGWGLEPVELSPPGLAQTLLRGAGRGSPGDTAISRRRKVNPTEYQVESNSTQK